MIFVLCLLAAAVALERKETRQLVRAWFDAQRGQWEELRHSCKTVILLFTDHDWLTLTAPLIREFRKYDQVKCVALVYWHYSNHSLSNVARLARDEGLLDQPIYVDSVQHLTSEWGSNVFFEKISTRIGMARHILEYLNDPYVVWTGLAMVDSDIVIRRNVIGRMERVGKTFVMQSETQCTSGTTLCPNGGFWRASGDKRSRRILQDVELMMHSLRIPDQDAFEIVLSWYADFGDTVHYLDPLLYTNGFTMRRNRDWRLDKSHMVHANWCTTLASKQRVLESLRRGIVAQCGE